MRNLLIILFLGLSISGYTKDKKKQIFIDFKIDNHNCEKGTVEGEASLLKSDLAEHFEKELPCYNILFRSDIVAMLGHERDRALLGNPDDAAAEEMFRQFANFDYVIVFNLSCFNGKVTITGSKFTSQNVEGENRYTGTGENDNVEFVDNYAKEFINELLYSEPCPYKGSIKIEEAETLNDDTAYEKKYIANLANNHVTEHFTSKEERKTIRKIELNKIGRIRTNGSYVSTMDWKFESHKSIEDGYICSMDHTDATVITNGDFTDDILKTCKWNISGIASFKDKDSTIQESEAKIHFAKNGTYTLEIRAVSDFGAYEGTGIEKTNSTCDGQQVTKDPPLSTKRNDSFNTTLGPFKGTPYDKLLKDKKTYNEVKGKETYKKTIEFSLAR